MSANGDRGPIADDDTLAPTESMAPPPLDGAQPRKSRLSLTEMRLSITDGRLSITGMRKSLLSIPLFNPRWKPWAPQRVALVTLAFALLAGFVVLVGHKVTPVIRAVAARAMAPSVTEEPDAPVAPPVRAEAPVRADAKLAREHRSPIAGGILTLPPAFASADGAYDLAIHFHGNPDLVEESYAVAGVNAAVVIFNLGNGSGVYEERFGDPRTLPEVLARVESTMEQRGLAGAHLRRLGLTAWSAGYGAVMKILDNDKLAPMVDAAILLDGIHIGFKQPSGELEMLRLAPFTRFAEQAVAGKKMFLITHSSIPSGRYAGAGVTTDALLKEVGVTRVEGGQAPPMPVLHSIEGVIPRKKIVPLEQLSQASRGGLHVRGFAGDQPESHIAHIVHMATLALPELVAHWRDAAQASR